MIASMTGFARREISGDWGALVCELRSVNHRFLESGFRLPDELRAAEGELRQRLARDIKRGKVDCSISYRRVQGAETALESARSRETRCGPMLRCARSWSRLGMETNLMPLIMVTGPPAPQPTRARGGRTRAARGLYQ